MKPSQLRARYRRIVFFFAGVTASFIFWEIFARRIGLGRISDRNRAARNRATAARFRALAVRMGGLMIKVGQFLSARLDILPPEITEELAGLQDEVPAESFEVIRMYAESELALTLVEHFASFDEMPLAAASLGQVHRACLRPEDAAEVGYTDVVVKVQRPGIEQIVEVDLAAIRRVGGWLQRYKPVRERANVPALIDEFASTTHEEIDYLKEGSNAETFAENFADNERVIVPRVVWQLTTRRVLTLEDVSAIKLSDYEAIEAAGISRSEVAAVLADTYFKQIFEDGFFHADPHPGNLFVTPVAPVSAAAGVGDIDDVSAGTSAEGSADVSPAWKLTFVDFGMVGRVPENLRAGLREMVIAVGLQDGARLVRAFKTLDVLLPSADLALIERASMAVFDRFGGMSMGELRDVDHSEMMRFGLQFQELMLNLPFQLPESLLLLGRSLAILSGMCTGLDPAFNIWESITPYATSLISDEKSGGAFGGSVGVILDEAKKILGIAVGLPARADRVLSQIERGELSVQAPMLELRVRMLNRSVRRISLALVFIGLLVAGAIVYSSGDIGFGRILMGASALPLIGVMMGGAGGHPGRQ